MPKAPIINPVKVASVFPFWSTDDMITAQIQDPDIGPVYNLIKEGKIKPQWEEVSDWSRDSKILLVDWDRLQLHEGMLYRKWVDNHGKVEWCQLTLPRTYREVIMKQIHDGTTGGHAGVHRTYQKMRTRCYFPRMKEYIRLWVGTCPICQKRKSPRHKAKAPMQVYSVGAPGERIALDIMGPFSLTESGNEWVLVIGDYFTKYKVAVPLPNITTVTVAEALVTNWICYFGVPYECHSDRGSQFQSSVFSGMCTILGIARTRTTTSRPQSDGMVENANRTLCDMLNCLVHDHPVEWDVLLKLCMLAYNTNVHESTKETPAMLMFGRELTLPVDLIMPKATNLKDTSRIDLLPQYVLDLQSRLNLVHDTVRKRVKTAVQRQEKYYNNRLHENSFEVGDVVYYNYPIKGNAPKEAFYQWKGPYVIVQRFFQNVYRIQKDQLSPPLVVNHDRLKHAKLRYPMDTSWVVNLQSPNQLA